MQSVALTQVEMKTAAIEQQPAAIEQQPAATQEKEVPEEYVYRRE